MVEHPYEIHLTVPPEEVDRLRAARVKVHSFVNVSPSGAVFQYDAMTSHAFSASDVASVIGIADDFASHLKRSYNVGVLRRKIETVPWHPITSEVMRNYYFETHFEVMGRASTIQGLRTPMSMSDHDKRYLTVRTHFHFGWTPDDAVTKDEHYRKINVLASELTRESIAIVGKVNTELVVFDDNLDHDRAWERLWGLDAWGRS